MDALVCKFCFRAQRPEANFCNYCGSSLVRSELRDRNASHSSNTVSSNSSSSWQNLSARSIALIVSLLALATLVVSLVIAAATSKSEAYQVGYNGWAGSISGSLYVEMRWNGQARAICSQSGQGLHGYSGTELSDYIRGCVDAFNDFNP